MLIELDPFAVGAEERALLAAHLRLPADFDAPADAPGAAAAAASLDAAFATAAALVERASGRVLKRRRFRSAAARWDEASALAAGPVSALLAVTLEDEAGGVAAFAVEDFRVDVLSDPARVIPRSGVAAPRVSPGGRASVEFEAGYGPRFADAPADLRAATLAVAAAAWERAAGGEDGAPALPPAAGALIAPYRRLAL